MAFLESAAVARALRDPGDTQIDTNRELLATAAANIAGAFFRTLPAAGEFSQSAVNKGAGARTQAAALVTVVSATVLGYAVGSLRRAALAPVDPSVGRALLSREHEASADAPLTATTTRTEHAP